MATNKERQKSLDKSKWICSEEFGQDLSGNMYYCECCGYATPIGCTATQEQREEKSLCAKAFNRVKRK